MEQKKLIGEPSTPPGIPPEETPKAEEDVNPFRAKFEESERRRSGLDREVTRLQQEKERLLAAVERGGNSQGVLSRLDKLELSWAEYLDAQGVTEAEGTPLSHKEQVLRSREEAAAKQKAEEKVAWETRVSMVWDDIVEDCQAKGVSPDIITQDPKFMSHWQAGDLRSARRQAAGLVASKAPSASIPSKGEGEAEETEEQRIERLAEEKSRQTLRARGLLKTEVGGGTGGRSPTTFTEEQLSDRAFWKANRAAIEKAQAEGKIQIK